MTSLPANLRESRRISKPRDSQANLRDAKGLQETCESGDSQTLPRTCAGAARAYRNTEGGKETREIREIRTGVVQSLWAGLVNREDIRAIAGRLGLPPTDTMDAWRLAILRIARSEDFGDGILADVPVRVEDWERWRSLQASPRKLLGLLRKLIYGVRIWD